ncbi:MAG: ABC transporter ATP-binding protein [Paracoccaceae bacterium]
MTDALLQLEGLTKAYPGVVANDGVSFSIKPGEVHALLGENGAGKSTLVKTIYGLVKPDAGRMTLNAKPFAPANPRAARAAGVAMVFQHFSLFEALNVAENIALGMDEPPGRRELSASIREVSSAYGLPLDPERLVGDLSAGERQRVEIVRCLLQNPKLLIMDEPTSVLTPQEVEILFHTLRKLASEGTSILYISHKLEEIRSLCEDATVLRLGKVVGTCDPREKTASELAEMMVGSALHVPARSGGEAGPVLLEVSGLNLPAPNEFGTSLRDISFKLNSGEVLGIGGVAGNGQDELLAALSGERLSAPGSVTLSGKDISRARPDARRALGLLSAPEERLGHSAAPGMSLTENALLTGEIREGLSSAGFIRWGKARDFAARIIEAFDVRTPGTETAAGALSGGNLQKFVIGREILQKPTVFVVNQPTWGVDAAAAASIRQAVLDLAAGGAGVIVISQDLDEAHGHLRPFHRAQRGHARRIRPARGLTIEEVGLMMGARMT